jgi:beta-N-acetylhexosaminidase
VKALEGGADVILMPSDLNEALDAIDAAMEDGTLTQGRIEQSVERILKKKLEYGIIPMEG